MTILCTYNYKHHISTGKQRKIIPLVFCYQALDKCFHTVKMGLYYIGKKNLYNKIMHLLKYFPIFLI